MNQRQDSLTDQMRDVLEAALAAGCYDAADWIRARWDACDVATAAHEPKKKEEEG